MSTRAHLIGICGTAMATLAALLKRKGVDVVAVCGGAPIRSQQAQLRAGGHVVVGTVGFCGASAGVVTWP